MKTAFASFALVLAFSACGTVNVLQPDGGRDRTSCAKDLTTMAVKVVDSNGVAVEGATVTATNAGLALTRTGTTDANGVTTEINQDIGQGTVTVKATLGSLSSASRTCTWTCSDQCLCAVEPKTLTLTLNP